MRYFSLILCRAVMVENFNRVRFEGLDPQKTYRINEINVFGKPFLRDKDQSYSGDYLMKEGLYVSGNTPMSSVVLELKAE